MTNKEEKIQDNKGAFKYPHFVVGFIIMFIYMGAEAILYQLMTPYFKEIGGINSTEAVKFSAFIFYGLMLGRLLGMDNDQNKTLNNSWDFNSNCSTSGNCVNAYWWRNRYLLCNRNRLLYILIFSLATTDLGKYTNQASSFLIMGIFHAVFFYHFCLE